jgi:hypothetical protein
MAGVASSKDALGQARTRMEKAVEDFRRELASIRTGRANVSLLDHVRVDYHGSQMPINQLGTVTVPDPMMLVISPWDPGAVQLIDKAIRTSDLGLNPTNDGKREAGRKGRGRTPGERKESKRGRAQAYRGRARQDHPQRDKENRGPFGGEGKRDPGTAVTPGRMLTADFNKRIT